MMTNQSFGKFVALYQKKIFNLYIKNIYITNKLPFYIRSESGMVFGALANKATGACKFVPLLVLYN